MRLRIKAVRQWRYNPKVVDGRPVKKPGYESLFHSTWATDDSDRVR